MKMENGEWIRKLDDETLACILGVLPITPPDRECRKSIKELCMLTVHAGITCNQCWLEWLQSDSPDAVDRSDECKD